MDIYIHFIKVNLDTEVITSYFPYIQELIEFEGDKYRVINRRTVMDKFGAVVYHYNAILEQ